jgi:hypothetical protein
VLRARTDNVPPRPPGLKSARRIVTTSGGGGASVVTVIVPVADPSPPQHALPVTLTGVLLPTRTVVTGNHATDEFCGTTTLLGTWMMSGRLFTKRTCAPCVAGPFIVILPVAGPVPPTLDGKNSIDTIEGPVGGGVVVIVAESVAPPADPTITENVPTPLCGCTSVVTVNVASLRRPES